MGDFNYNCYNPGNELENELHVYEFERKLAHETSTTNRNTQIDIIFGKQIEKYKSNTHETYFSDHKAIYISIEDDTCATLKNTGSESLQPILVSSIMPTVISDQEKYYPIFQDPNFQRPNDVHQTLKADLTIGYFCVGNLKAHKEIMNESESYSDIDILILAESSTRSKDLNGDICLEGFDILFRYDKIEDRQPTGAQKSTSKCNGIIALVKKNAKGAISYKDVEYNKSSNKRG